MPNGSRNFHHKSHKGCKRCKTRRVKCNKQAPVCANCRRRNEDCEYEIPPPNPAAITVFALPAAQLGDITSFISVSFLSNVIVGCVPASRPERALWCAAFGEALAGCQYLQHTMLSIHTLHVGPRLSKDAFSEATNLAHHHHIMASNAFTHMAPVVNEQNWLAVFIFGISVIIFRFATQQYCPDHLFDYLEMLQVLRISSNIARSVSSYLFRSEMWPFIRDRASLQLICQSDDIGMQQAIENLEGIVSNYRPRSENRRKATPAAFEAFKTWVITCHGYPSVWRHYIDWPATIQTEFLNDIREEEDVPLLLLIYWCAIMYRGPRRWFMEVWLRRTATVVVKKLDGDWNQALVWPLETLQIIHQ
ncbi:uncharacterized protein BDZ99DRAFT_457601 [Mytilinidion resinicola]|uniref:Zn(2)-C6 fungal-type domain-containing protein n=1 Tax=Mytilinidion resinicola TaxID=574789 RepID=A0A6A6Z3G7_9PEZI|nr:uncharacterized protein BDZ99DRAFT_457601 [Mytilinidion resinicola]KAF2815626.1 hypothetical protein BDZ99DRAFT_457601 [Mytilinidion resinicola]